ncbi:sugar phosphate isomerase/epimerase family protein [Phenylobacterium sp.]|uniref:sugar phosphate isomerase/epimerase family protein n=1 Tax=Phenylobacterium sp. TaxID=1871053 RepID=UPI002FDFB50A
MRTNPDLNRRGLLMAAGAALGAAAVSGPASAAPFFAGRRLPIGIQLYTLGPDVAKDLEGVLGQVAKIGYRTVELAGLYGRTPADFKAALDRAGLVATSAHIQARGPGSFEGDLSQLADMLGTLGVKNAVMPSPYVPDRVTEAAKGLTGGDFYRKAMGSLTADDYRFNADYLNEKAAVLKRAGIAVGYHNHNFELAPQGETTGLDILLSRTDPSLVTFEADVGWISAAGVDPAAYLSRHKGRFSLMHVKDVKAATQTNYELRMDPTEVGSGRLDWRTLLPAAHAAGVRHFYVEQEPPFERPRIEAAKISHDFLAAVNA